MGQNGHTLAPMLLHRRGGIPYLSGLVGGRDVERARLCHGVVRTTELTHHCSVELSSNAVKRAFRLFVGSKHLGFGAFSGPDRPQEGLEKAPGSGPDRFAPISSPADQI